MDAYSIGYNIGYTVGYFIGCVIYFGPLVVATIVLFGGKCPKRLKIVSGIIISILIVGSIISLVGKLL